MTAFTAAVPRAETILCLISKLTDEEKLISKDENFISFVLRLTQPGPAVALVQYVKEIVTEPGPSAL